MGNQNATAIPEDDKVVGHPTEISGQNITISPDDINQVTCTAQQTHAVSSDQLLGAPPSEPPDLQPQVNTTEENNNGQVQPPSEVEQPHHQFETRHETEPQDDDQVLKNTNSDDNEVRVDSEVGVDSNLNKKCVSQEAQPLEDKLEDALSNQPVPDCTEQLQTEEPISEVESNSEQHTRIQKETTDVIEDVSDRESCASEMDDFDDHSTNQVLGVIQANIVDTSTDHILENVEESAEENPGFISHDTSVEEADTLASAENPPTTDFSESLEEEIEEDKSRKEEETKNDIQACDQSHKVLSNGRNDQEFIKVNEEIQEDDTNDASCVTDNLTSSSSEGQENHADLHQMLEEISTPVSEDLPIIRHNNEGESNGYDHQDSMSNGLLQMFEEPITRHEGVSNGDDHQHITSNGFNDNDKVSDKDNVVEQIQLTSHHNCVSAAQVSELDCTKPEVQGFIFTNESTNYIQFEEEEEAKASELKVENDDIERTPSFKFEVNKETPQQELFNQTPLLYQGKPPLPIRSLSTPANVFLANFTASDHHQNGQNFMELSVNKTGIRLERNESDKSLSKTPLLRLENNVEQGKHNEGLSNSNGHSKGKHKHKTIMSCFFSNCVCCAGVADF